MTIMKGTISTTRDHETSVDMQLVLGTLWVMMLFVFLYVDIVGSFQADVLNTALDDTIASRGLTVDQVFLTSTLVFVVLPGLMVILSLVLTQRVNRVVNIAAGLLYAVTIIVAAVGRDWTYYFLGSSLEVVLLAAIVRSAWRWPPPVGRRR